MNTKQKVIVTLAIVIITIIAGFGGVETFTLSTVPADRADAAEGYILMLVAAGSLLFISGILWFKRYLVVAITLAVAALLTAGGLLTWFAAVFVTLASIVLLFALPAQKRREISFEQE